MSDSKDKEEKRDPFDGEYIGNIWGWKFSLFGLALIVVLILLLWYRSATTGVPWNAPAPAAVEQPDSLQ